MTRDTMVIIDQGDRVSKAEAKSNPGATSSGEGNGQPLKHADITEAIIGVFYAVYNHLGTGFLESVYESAMEIELREAGLEPQRQQETSVYFKGRCVGKFLADMVVAGRVIVELKASRAMTAQHEAQLLNLLRATNLEVGLLLNFGPRPEFKRFVFSNARKPCFFERH